MAIIDSKKNLPHFYNVEGLLGKYMETFNEQLTDASDAIDDLRLKIFVDTSTNVELDQLAKLFLIFRANGEADDVLRARIKNYWQSHKVGGLNSELQAVIANYAPFVILNSYTEEQLRVVIDMWITIEYASAVVNDLEATKAAGVRLFLNITRLFTESEGDLEIANETLTIAELDYIQEGDNFLDEKVLA